MKVISTIPDLIEVFGGATRLARWAGYEDYRGVHNWISRGIPPSYHLRLTLEARRQGIFIDPGVFGLEDDDAESLKDVLCSSRAKTRRVTSHAA